MSFISIAKNARLLTICFFLFSLLTYAQKTDKPDTPADTRAVSDPELSVTKHTITLAGEKINYTATAGYLPQRDESGTIKANIFFVAYTRDGVTNPATRPVTYTYNGGPGSASVWLHMGALAPKRIVMGDDGSMLAPPYTVTDNDYTWLAFTDLVFIDPVMTGYSRPAEGWIRKSLRATSKIFSRWAIYVV